MSKPKRATGVGFLFTPKQKKMKNDIVDNYALRMYVRGFYIENAGKRGGETFKPPYKKDLKPFQMRVKHAVNFSEKVLSIISERYPINSN